MIALCATLLFGGNGSDDEYDTLDFTLTQTQPVVRNPSDYSSSDSDSEDELFEVASPYESLIRSPSAPHPQRYLTEVRHDSPRARRSLDPCRGSGPNVILGPNNEIMPSPLEIGYVNWWHNDFTGKYSPPDQSFGSAQTSWEEACDMIMREAPTVDYVDVMPKMLSNGEFDTSRLYPLVHLW